MSDLATGVDAYRGGDDSSTREARDIEPDSAIVVIPSDGGAGDVGAKDTLSFEVGGPDQQTTPPLDALNDGPGSRDGVSLEDAGIVDGSTLNGDAPMTEDTAPVVVDSAVVDTPPVLDPDLVLWYPFDESSGTIAYDSARFGGVARNATLAKGGRGGNATFTTAKQVGTHALALSPAPLASNGGGYVEIPALDTLAPGAATIALWVNLAAATPNQDWERVYDFGDSSTGPRWFNLSARNGDIPNGPVFNISNVGHAEADQQRITGSTALTANTWHHVAVVLAADATYTGIMYVDGVVAASNSSMTVHLSDIGATANNWLGRSQFANDPYFNGSLDDFRVYRRALSQQEIVALMALR